MIVTIDGPTASGKSSTAMLLARKLGFYYLNSGLLYRAVAYLLMHKGYTYEALHVLGEKDLSTVVDVHRITYTCDKETNPHVGYDGSELTSCLKSVEIDRAVSIVSAKPFVRQLLLAMQHAIGAQHDLVIDGRDTGTVVFPQADFKFYLTAPLEVRARRWMHDQQAHGVSIGFDEAYKQIAERDERDMTRAISPLRIPEDATIVDNGSHSLNETVDILYKNIMKNSSFCSL